MDKQSLINVIMNDNSYEPGFVSTTDFVVKAMFKENEFLARAIILEIFNDIVCPKCHAFYDESFEWKLFLGLVHVVSRLDYDVIGTIGLSIATVAISKKQDEIKEAGIMAFENWSNVISLTILKTMIPQQTTWLNDYLKGVIKDIQDGLLGKTKQKIDFNIYFGVGGTGNKIQSECKEEVFEFCKIVLERYCICPSYIGTTEDSIYVTFNNLSNSVSLRLDVYNDFSSSCLVTDEIKRQIIFNKKNSFEDAIKFLK